MSTIKRKLALCLGLTLSVGAFAAPIAQAFEVTDGTTGITCSEVTLSGTTVSGGCLIDAFEGEFDLKSGTSLLGTYNGDFDLKVGPSGKLYAVDQVVYVTYGIFGREACRTTANGPKIPWAGQIKEVAPGDYQAEVTVCLSSPGKGGTYETITVDIDPYDPWGVGMQLQQTPATGWFQDGFWSSPNGVYIEPV